MEEKTKYQRPQSEVICNCCGKNFLKSCSEIRRTNKLGTQHYCSLSCVRTGKVGNPNGTPSVLISNNRNDKYTGLREHLTRAKQRTKEVNITLDDLLEIWDEQKGICPYTGIKLVHPRDKNNIMMYKASLDRIDSSLGYIKGNIQFISATANLAKHTMTHKEMVAFCKIVTNHWKNK